MAQVIPSLPGDGGLFPEVDPWRLTNSVMRSHRPPTGLLPPRSVESFHDGSASPKQAPAPLEAILEVERKVEQTSVECDAAQILVAAAILAGEANTLPAEPGFIGRAHRRTPRACHDQLGTRCTELASL
jgi:hypothetical protein